MRAMARQLLLMLQFFTRLPLPWQLNVKEEDFQKGILFLPVVGLVVGLINASVFFVTEYAAGKDVAIIAVLCSNLWVTGAFHLDGLADTCDGIYSSRTRERMLEIMKDSRVGTNGACVIVLDFGLRWTGLHVLSSEQAVAALVLMPLLARSCNALLMHGQYARENGLGNLFVGKVSKERTLLALLLGLGMSLTFMSVPWIFVLWGVLVLFQLLFHRYISRILGGMTGDTLGAGDELSELLVLLFLCTAVHQGGQW